MCYSWKHDSILKKIDALIRKWIDHQLEFLYSDLPGLRAEENPCATVPLSLVITTARPDMVYVNDSGAD